MDTFKIEIPGRTPVFGTKSLIYVMVAEAVLDRVRKSNIRISRLKYKGSTEDKELRDIAYDRAIRDIRGG